MSEQLNMKFTLGVLLKLSSVSLMISVVIFSIIRIVRFFLYSMNGSLDYRCQVYQLCSPAVPQDRLIPDAFISILASVLIVGLIVIVLSRRRKR